VVADGSYVQPGKLRQHRVVRRPFLSSCLAPGPQVVRDDPQIGCGNLDPVRLRPRVLALHAPPKPPSRIPHATTSSVEAGRDLKTVIETLGAWGVRWAFDEPRPEALDAGLLIWRIHQRINRELLPVRRTVVQFDFTGPRGRRVWLLLEPREVSVCVTPPGFDSDLIVRSDLAFFYRIWLGHIEYGAPVRCRSVVVDGSPALAKQLPRWFMWSPMARFVREREHTMAQASGLVRDIDRHAV
jgi:hypothetical protein